MPVKTNNLSEIFNAIKTSANSVPKKILVGAGDYNVKCVSAEVKKSLKGKQMALLVWEVIDGESKGGTVKQYTMIDSYDEANPWKYGTLVAAFEAYGVNLDSVCSVADSIEEAFAMATTKLNKKVETINPNVSITLTRKENGTNSEGKPIFRDYYNFGKTAEPADKTTEPEEPEAEKSQSQSDAEFAAALE